MMVIVAAVDPDAAAAAAATPGAVDASKSLRQLVATDAAAAVATTTLGATESLLEIADTQLGAMTESEKAAAVASGTFNRSTGEFDLPASVEWPVKNKLVMMLIQMFGLGCCGIDRCYMGQVCCGVVKFITLGGLTVWAAIDALYMYNNGLNKEPVVD